MKYTCVYTVQLQSLLGPIIFNIKHVLLVMNQLDPAWDYGDGTFITYCTYRVHRTYIMNIILFLIEFISIVFLISSEI